MNEAISATAAKVAEHEDAAHEKRQWIRLTSMCNNLCTFCLDTLAHNGTYSSDEEVKARIIEGRKKGATRLILSGGEPTIHPNYIKFIKLGRMAGYSKIQTVTNGRMFSYPDFLKRCLDAGLDEITFSIHGHNAKVHDALVGVPGAFVEEVEGLRLAMADGRPIINIDVCLNKGNIRKLPELLDKFIGMGVKEYDLLHLIPFGMAWDEKHRNQLVYDIDEAYPYIQKALEYSERPDMHIWFNRFPPPYLEGYEELIQDPYKLHDECRGRFEEFELWITRDMPISCREKERCDRCYLQNVCDNLESSMVRVRSGDFDAYRVRVGELESPNPSPHDIQYLWLDAPNAETAAANLELATGDLVLQLQDWTGAELEGDVFHGRTVARALVHRPEDLAPLLSDGHTFNVTALLTTTMADALLADFPEGHERLTIAVPNYERATEADAELPDIPAFFEAWSGQAETENVPRCVTGQAPRTRLRVLDSEAVRAQELDYTQPTPGDTGGRGSILKEIAKLSVGDPAKTRYIQERLGLVKPVVEGAQLDLFGFVGEYIRSGYYAKSLRCRECAFNDSCEGLHVSTVRSKGFAMLNPIELDVSAAE